MAFSEKYSTTTKTKLVPRTGTTKNCRISSEFPQSRHDVLPSISKRKKYCDQNSAINMDVLQAAFFHFLLVLSADERSIKYNNRTYMHNSVDLTLW